MIASFHQVIPDLEVQIGVLVGEINTNYNKLLETQDEHTQRLQRIEATQDDHTKRFQRLEAILYGIGFPAYESFTVGAGPSRASPPHKPIPTETIHTTPPPSQPIPKPTLQHQSSSSISSSTATIGHHHSTTFFCHHPLYTSTCSHPVYSPF
ncbi:hypothetical protein K1719_034731 [Acacia pycnantha]|nr:hypothetical protein K1719_034731 [Acacia pycnantha]